MKSLYFFAFLLAIVPSLCRAQEECRVGRYKPEVEETPTVNTGSKEFPSAPETHSELEGYQYCRGRCEEGKPQQQTQQTAESAYPQPDEQKYNFQECGPTLHSSQSAAQWQTIYEKGSSAGHFENDCQMITRVYVDGIYNYMVSVQEMPYGQINEDKLTWQKIDLTAFADVVQEYGLTPDEFKEQFMVQNIYKRVHE